MNDNRMKRWMDAIDDDLLEEAQRPLPRGGAARRWDESPPLQRRCEKAGGIRSRETPAQRESGDLHRGGSHGGGRILRRADSVCHLPAVPAGAADFFGAPAPHGFFIGEELYYEFV